MGILLSDSRVPPAPDHPGTPAPECLAAYHSITASAAQQRRGGRGI